MSTAPPLFAFAGLLPASRTGPTSAEPIPGVAQPRAVHSGGVLVSSFGEDSSGELFVLAPAGGMYRLEAR